MEREILVSGGDAVRVISLDGAEQRKSILLEGAGALCAVEEHVFCACNQAIWKLERKTLMPQALLSGGPGIREMLFSDDQSKMYVLCGDADSVLMLDGRTGEPLLINRAGVNPQQMALDGDVLAIAGGESGYVFLFCAQSLRMLRALSMPGPVYSVMLFAGSIYALCLTPSLSSVLVTQPNRGTQNTLYLSGMPGRIRAGQNVLLAETEGVLYAISLDGKQILMQQNAPGRASWLQEVHGKLLLLDAYSDRLFSHEHTGWRLLCKGVCAAAADGA